MWIRSEATQWDHWCDEIPHWVVTRYLRSISLQAVFQFFFVGFGSNTRQIVQLKTEVLGSSLLVANK